MKAKRIFSCLAAAALCFGLSVAATAANRVNEIAVDVTLSPDGSAFLVQTWDGSFFEGTECYFPVTHLGEITLDGLTVADADGEYRTLDGWRVDASFEEKAKTCGLNPVDDGYEVCWGISQYGDNRYAVEYRLGGLVGAYDDYDGFLFQFVPSGMGTLPTNVTVRIHTQDGTMLTEQNAAIWGFGFEGQIGFTEDGGVLAYTETSLSEETDSVIVMLQLQKGVLTPTRAVSGSFEEVKTRAFEGSDYGEDDGGGLFPFLLFAVPIGIGLLWWFGGAEGRKVKKLYRSANYFREAPLAGNLEAAHRLARDFYQSDDDGNLIAATLMRLLAAGCLVPLTESNVGFMGREKETVSLRLVKPPDFRSVAAKELYALLTLAAGSDQILQERELEGYSKRNYQAMLRVMQNAERDGRETLVGIGCYRSAMKLSGLHNLSERGQGQLMNLLGFKKYLLDFSLIGERGVSEAIIWQDYLTFATLLGIADRVMEQLGKLYPDTSVYQRQAQTAYYVAYRYQRATWAAAKNAESAAKRAAGGGGSSSRGGGGGFSGGGHGGGTR